MAKQRLTTRLRSLLKKTVPLKEVEKIVQSLTFRKQISNILG